MEKDLLKQLGIKIIILSRSRSGTITTHKLLPNYIEILVPDNQVEEYKKVVDNPVIAIPKELEGLGKVRNWCLNNFKEETVIMIDDDIKKCYCLTAYKARDIDDPDELIQILINTAVMAKDSGAKCFGFFQTDIRKYNGTEPFGLCTWVGCIIGVIGRKHLFRDDKYKVDIDFCLKNLLTERIIWVDNRYYFIQSRDNNMGGNSIFRDEEEYQKSLDDLKTKWGRFLKQGKSAKSNIKLSINVKRRQQIEYEK